MFWKSRKNLKMLSSCENGDLYDICRLGFKCWKIWNIFFLIKKKKLMAQQIFIYSNSTMTNSITRCENVQSQKKIHENDVQKGSISGLSLYKFQEFVLMSFLLVFDIFHTLLKCFYCWNRKGKYCWERHQRRKLLLQCRHFNNSLS